MGLCVYLVTQLLPTLCKPMDCSLPGSSAPGILQARILEWVAISYSRGSSQTRDWTWVSCFAGGGFFTGRATRETPWMGLVPLKEAPESSLPPPTTLDHEKSETGKGVLTWHAVTWPTISSLQDCKTKITVVYKLSNLWYFVTAAQTDQNINNKLTNQVWCCWIGKTTELGSKPSALTSS